MPGRCILILFIVFSFSFLFAENLPQSDRERMRIASDSLLSQIIEEAGLVPASSVYLSCDASFRSTPFYFAVSNLFYQRNISVSTDSAKAARVFAISVRRASVIYGETFTESFFSPQYTERTISLSFDAVVQDSLKILYAASKSLMLRDTVRYADTEGLHDFSSPFSSYTPPSLSFFDSLLEPIVVTIASGIAVYLFFTIRS